MAEPEPAQPPQRSDAARNHEAIVTAAIAVLADQPVASMAEIAQASGTGRTTLYRHFPDRLTLVRAIYDRVLAEAEQVAIRRLEDDAHADPVAVVAQLADELSALGIRYRFLARYEADLADPLGSDQHGEPLRSYLRDAQRRGQIADEFDLDWLLAALVALIGEATLHSFADPGQRSVQLTAAVARLLAP